MTQFPAAHLRTVRRLEREYRAACTREEHAETVEAAQRLALASDRVARRLAAARDGRTIEAPRTRRNLARGAFAALATIGAAVGRALARVEALRKATIAASMKRAARKVAALARLALRRAVAAVAALVVASPAIAEAHPGHDGGLHHIPAPAVGGLIITVGVLATLASKAWDAIEPRRRRLVAAVEGHPDEPAGGSEPEPERLSAETSDGVPRVIRVGGGDPGDECEHTNEHGEPCGRRPSAWSIPRGSGYVVACDEHARDLVLAAVDDGSIYPTS